MLEKNSQNQIFSFSLNTNVSECSSLRVEAKFSFKFDLCILNLQIEILNFYRLVKIIVKNLVIKSFKLTFSRLNLQTKKALFAKKIRKIFYLNATFKKIAPVYRWEP